MHVAVLGAGVIGLTTAKALLDAGHEVTVVDQSAGVGTGTSYANGAQLSYSYVAPLAGPGVLSKLPGWMLRRDSPVRFRPRLSIDQWRWCWSFVRACNSRQSDITTRRLLALSVLSRTLMHQLVDAEPSLVFDYAKSGKLVFHRDNASMASATGQLEYQRKLGCEQIALTPQQCVELEPALASVKSEISGGIFTESEDAGDCFKFCVGLERYLRHAGVRFLMNTPVEALQSSNDGRIVAISRGNTIHADQYVVATGVDARSLLKNLQINVPLYPLKGYSLTYGLSPDAHAPRVSVTDFARKVVYARIGERLRVAGIADLEGNSLHANSERIQTLRDEVRHTFPRAVHDSDTPTEWVGLRPATPTGMPIIGPTSYKNLWLNLGQGALGFTLAAGSASLVAGWLDGSLDKRLGEMFQLGHSSH